MRTLRFWLWQFIVFELIVLGVAAVISLVAGGLSWKALASNVVLVGGLVGAYGLIARFGALSGSNRSFGYQFSATIFQDRHERVRDDIKHQRENALFANMSLLLSFLTILLGFVMQMLV